MIYPLLVAGVDEAGRGPLAGAVYAAAVILDPDNPIAGLDDSKKLSAARRAVLEQQIFSQAVSWCVSSASAAEIDNINILQATLLAMTRAVEGLSIAPGRVRVDGNRLPALACPGEAIIGGDSLHAEISAASILAKEARDREMVSLGASYPQYGFEKHKGYPTREHLVALAMHGPCNQHRRSFAPVRKALEQ